MMTRFTDHLARHPSGWVAHAIAAVFAVFPTVANEFPGHRVYSSGDTISVVATVVQVYSHGDRDLTDYCAVPRDGRWAAMSSPDADPYWVRRDRDGAGRYSSYPAGMEVFAWPAVLIAAARGHPIGRDYCQYSIEMDVAAFAGGLCLGLFFLTGLCVARAGPVLVATAFLATGSAVTTTLTQLLWQQTGVVFWVLVVLLVELRGRGRVGRIGTLIQAVACSQMFACRPSAVTFLVPFGLWVLARDWRRGLLLPALALVAFLPWALAYRAVYGNWFGPGMIGMEVTWTPLANVGGVLFSPARGLLVYQPWVWVLPLLCLRRVRGEGGRLPAGWYAFALAVLACHVLMVGSWPVWWGGCCWGSRLAAEVIPVAGLLALNPIAWLLGRRWGWAVLALAGAAGLMAHLPYLYGDGGWWNSVADIDTHPERLWDWRNPPFLYRDPP